MSQEVTWEWAITPEKRNDGRPGRAPIEGGVGEPDEDWRRRVLDRLENVDAWPRVEFVVFVQNVDLSSSSMGAYNIVVAGPGYTWTKDAIDGMQSDRMSYRVGELPSQFMYPQWYISRQKHLTAKEQT